MTASRSSRATPVELGDVLATGPEQLPSERSLPVGPLRQVMLTGSSRRRLASGGIHSAATKQLDRDEEGGGGDEHPEGDGGIQRDHGGDGDDERDSLAGGGPQDPLK
jgi:hypothetical protein